MTEIEIREIREAIDAADNALLHLRSARKYLDSASNWGLLDMFGGNLITGLVKHSKMGNAEREIFADFFFDGFVADILVQSKISDGKRQCDDAIRQVEAIKRELQSKL